MESNEGAGNSTIPAIRIEPPPPLSPDPQVPASPNKSKPANQARGKVVPSRRGFALKRYRMSATNSHPDANSTDINQSTNEARSVSPLPPTDKPVKDAVTDGSSKHDGDTWSHRKTSSPFTDYDLEELLRSRSLRRVTTRIQEDNKASADVDKIPERCLTEEVCGKMWERSKATVNVIEKLQKHFSVVKEKLYRARCLGMDQGIEAVQKGDSPFLEQHLMRIQQTRQDEMNKAKALQEARKASIDVEYDSAVTALWQSMDLELARRMKLARHRLVEDMIKNESDFMHTQLRHVFTKLKENATQGNPTSQIIHGVLIDISAETNLDEAMADLWKMMKASIKERHWNEYLCPAAEMRLEEEESVARQNVIRETLLQGGKPSESASRRKNSLDSDRGKRKRQKSGGGINPDKESGSSTESGLNAIAEEAPEEEETTSTGSTQPDGSGSVVVNSNSHPDVAQ